MYSAIYGPVFSIIYIGRSASFLKVEASSTSNVDICVQYIVYYSTVYSTVDSKVYTTVYNTMFSIVYSTFYKVVFSKN